MSDDDDAPEIGSPTLASQVFPLTHRQSSAFPLRSLSLFFPLPQRPGRHVLRQVRHAPRPGAPLRRLAAVPDEGVREGRRGGGIGEKGTERKKEGVMEVLREPKIKIAPLQPQQRLLGRDVLGPEVGHLLPQPLELVLVHLFDPFPLRAVEADGPGPRPGAANRAARAAPRRRKGRRRGRGGGRESGDGGDGRGAAKGRRGGREGGGGWRAGCGEKSGG